MEKRMNPKKIISLPQLRQNSQDNPSPNKPNPIYARRPTNLFSTLETPLKAPILTNNNPTKMRKTKLIKKSMLFSKLVK